MYTPTQVRQQISIAKILSSEAEKLNLTNYLALINREQSTNAGIFHPGILVRTAYCYFVWRYNKFKEIKNATQLQKYYERLNVALSEYEVFTHTMKKFFNLLLAIDPTELACPTVSELKFKFAEKVINIALLKETLMNPYFHLLALRKRKNEYRADPGAVVLLFFLLALFNELTEERTAAGEICLNLGDMCNPLDFTSVPLPPLFPTTDIPSLSTFYTDLSTTIRRALPAAGTPRLALPPATHVTLSSPQPTSSAAPLPSALLDAHFAALDMQAASASVKKAASGGYQMLAADLDAAEAAEKAAARLARATRGGRHPLDLARP